MSFDLYSMFLILRFEKILHLTKKGLISCTITPKTNLQSQDATAGNVKKYADDEFLIISELPG